MCSSRRTWLASGERQLVRSEASWLLCKLIRFSARLSAFQPTSEERERIKSLEREVRELRQANEILRKASAYFAQAELDRPFKR